MLVRDTWDPVWRTATESFRLEGLYPLVHGFPFANERDGTQFDEFSGVFQWKAYDCVLAFPPGVVIPPVETCLGCRVPNPVYLTFYSLVFTP